MASAFAICAPPRIMTSTANPNIRRDISSPFGGHHGWTKLQPQCRTRRRGVIRRAANNWSHFSFQAGPNAKGSKELTILYRISDLSKWTAIDQCPLKISLKWLRFWPGGAGVGDSALWESTP